MEQPIAGGAALAGIADAVHLVGIGPGAAGRPARQHRGRERLEAALDAVVAALDAPPATPVEWVQRLGELDALAGTVRAQARALDGDGRAGTPPDVVVWAEALGAAIASHARDLDTMVPWARLLLAGEGTWSAGRSGALETLATSVPALAENADRCEAAMREVAALRGGPVPGAGVGPGAPCDIDTFSGALERSAAAGAAWSAAGRLAASAQAMATGMDFGFLFEPVRRLLSIGYRATDGPSMPAGTICSPPRPALRASSRSPRATSRCPTGSVWAVR